MPFGPGLLGKPHNCALVAQFKFVASSRQDEMTDEQKLIGPLNELVELNAWDESSSSSEVTCQN